MSPWDGFVYNFLTMGVIFPWVYMQGPGAFPGAMVELAIVIALIAQLPISLSYTWLATVLPVSGGDYIFQTRAFGKFGYITVMSGFVIWILAWVAISGNLFATLGLAPLFLSLGVFLEQPRLCLWGIEVQSTTGILMVSFGLAFFTTLILTRGLRLYVKIQKYLFLSTLAAVIAVISIFYTHSYRSVDSNLTSFVKFLVQHFPATLPSPHDVSTSFLAFLQGDVLRHLPSEVQRQYYLQNTFSIRQTLLIVPIAWTSLQWATYSVEQNSEIQSADRYKAQFFMLVCSAVFAAGVMLLLAYSERTATTFPVLRYLSAGYKGHASDGTRELLGQFLQPYPNVLAMAISRSKLLTIIIGLGFIANSFQITCNSFIGASRILVAMATDGVLPRRLGLDVVERQNHSPSSALWLYFFCSIPFIIVSNLSPGWAAGCTMGVTIGCGYVFALTSLAATRIPSKMRAFWMCSDVYKVSPRLIQIVGFIGAGLGFAMVIPYLFFRRLWPGYTPSRSSYDVIMRVIIAALVVAVLLCYRYYHEVESREREVTDGLRKIPREVKDFYE